MYKKKKNYAAKLLEEASTQFYYMTNTATKQRELRCIVYTKSNDDTWLDFYRKYYLHFHSSIGDVTVCISDVIRWCHCMPSLLVDIHILSLCITILNNDYSGYVCKDKISIIEFCWTRSCLKVNKYDISISNLISLSIVTTDDFVNNLHFSALFHPGWIL